MTPTPTRRYGRAKKTQGECACGNIATKKLYRCWECDRCRHIRQWIDKQANLRGVEIARQRTVEI
jgi:hypothetical protein